jgi:hypothetical protein
MDGLLVRAHRPLETALEELFTEEGDVAELPASSWFEDEPPFPAA